MYLVGVSRKRIKGGNKRHWTIYGYEEDSRGRMRLVTQRCSLWFAIYFFIRRDLHTKRVKRLYVE